MVHLNECQPWTVCISSLVIMKSTIENYISIMLWILSGKSGVRTETGSLKTRNIGSKSHGSLR